MSREAADRVSTPEPGRRRAHPAQIADEVRSIVADIIDELDRWLTTWR
jgi:hypothetical protein